MDTRALAYYPYRTPYGILTICSSPHGLAGIAFGQAAFSGTRAPSDVTNRAINELLEYFAGKRTAFDIAIDLQGSEFQKAVWNRVCRVPYGTTTTSRDIAKALGDEDAYRAVGIAIGKNPLPIVVPTHRIVGANGRPLASEPAPDVFAGLRNLERATAQGDNALPRY